MSKKIAVTGGCGYIGSHTLVDLLQNGYEVFSVDSLVNSTEVSLVGIEKITGTKIKNYKLDLADPLAWQQLLEFEKDVSGIIHFAALKAVGESVEQPLRYYDNNLNALLNVFKWMDLGSVPYLIFSSSCTVYGDRCELPVRESQAFGKTNSPYGKTKQIGEWMMEDVLAAQHKQGISLRYFNPAGAHESSWIGEAPSNPALNLVPVITETAIGKRDTMTVFGNDYPTRDGTCIRDYVHVMDLARAHTLALNYLIEGKSPVHFDAFNLGIGQGLSVLEMIEAFEKCAEQKLNYKMGSRRLGDMAEVYADAAKASALLDWKPLFGVEDIMRTAWEWEKRRGI
ncbi:MAG: UDP-glucose 4-epimerase GalE [Saprospiraceae bacterium]|nr:UDP-glucose 4-epimerase GalE [Saprospiraceae bacterium]